MLFCFIMSDFIFELSVIVDFAGCDTFSIMLFKMFIAAALEYACYDISQSKAFLLVGS